MHQDDILDKFLEELSDEDNKQKGEDDYGDEFDSFEEEQEEEEEEESESTHAARVEAGAEKIMTPNSVSSSPSMPFVNNTGSCEVLGISDVVNSSPGKDAISFANKQTVQCITRNAAESTDDRVNRIEAFIAQTLPDRANKQQRRRMSNNKEKVGPPNPGVLISENNRITVKKEKTADHRHSQIHSTVVKTDDSPPHHLISYTDGLKAEIGALHGIVQQLQQALQETEGHLRQSRKVNKKLQSKLDASEQLSQAIQEMEDDCEQMKYREKALLEAVSLDILILVVMFGYGSVKSQICKLIFVDVGRGTNLTKSRSDCKAQNIHAA